MADRQVRFADVATPRGAGGTSRHDRRLWLAAGIVAVLVVAAAALLAWTTFGSQASDAPAGAEAVQSDAAGNGSAAPPAPEAIVAMLVAADDLPTPSGGSGTWTEVGEFRRTFESGKAYDRCSGSLSPGDANRVSHEYRFGSEAVFASEAVTGFANDDSAAAFYDAEGRSIPGCNEADTEFVPVSVPGTDAAVTATSGTARVIRMRKGAFVATITADPAVDWQAMAEKAASRIAAS